jgi:hypothetical protein
MLSAKHGGDVSHIKSRYVELKHDDDGWKQVYVVETDLELDATDDRYDEKAVGTLMDELRDLQGLSGFDVIHVKPWRPYA